MRIALLVLPLAGLLAIAPAQAQQAGAPVPQLAPHQALYFVRALKPEGAQLQGSLSIEARRDCELWNVRLILDVKGKRADGEEARYRLAQYYRESLDALAMAFRVEKDLDGETSSITGRGGFETREAPGSYEVFLNGATEPETGELPVNTLFAASATRIMLRELKTGQKSFGIQVFDAVNDFRPKVEQINLLREEFDRSTVPLNDHPLLAGDAWLIRQTQVHDEKAINTNMVLHDTGIISVMGFALGPLVMQADLTLLKRLDAPSC